MKRAKRKRDSKGPLVRHADNLAAIYDLAGVIILGIPGGSKPMEVSWSLSRSLGMGKGLRRASRALVTNASKPLPKRMGKRLAGIRRRKPKGGMTA